MNIHNNVASIVMEAELDDRSKLDITLVITYMNMVIATEVITMRLKKRIGILKE